MAHQQWLCQRCIAIPFDPNLKILSSSGYSGPKNWQLGKFGVVRQRSCHFCQLVASICEKYHSSWDPHTPLDDDEYISVTFRQTHFTADSARAGTAIYAAGNIDGKAPAVARESFDNWIDFDEVKRWIARCDNKHRDKELECSPMPFNLAILPRIDTGQLDFRLIDVDAMCIAYAPRKSKYVALSYVWGRTSKPRLTLASHNEEALSRPKALEANQSKIPNTIWDAITVVRKLGERYLWVDSLCLLQDDQRELQECVAVMDLFYEMATFTIVAAGGEDAFAGLDGVPPTRRKIPANSVKDIVPGLKMTTVVDVDTLLRKSVYNSRAWTMQEEILSHRVLIFIAGQVYWKCQYSYIDERLNWQNRGSILDQFSSVGSLYYALLRYEPAEFVEFSTILQYYMSKQLSFESDVLRAAQGMLRKFSALSGLHCFEGLPSPLDQSTLFATSNIPKSRAFGRRNGFPSYSWAGWKSTPDYASSVEYGTLQRWVIWFCKFKDGQTYQFSETGRLRKAPPPEFENAIKSAVNELKEIPTTVSDSDLYIVRAKSYPLLIFWTVVINLRLKPKSYIPGYLTGHVNYELIDRYGRNLDGEVQMDMASSADEMQVGKFAILASSNTEFWALLLKWENGVAERRGVVTLSKDVLGKCLDPGPRWRAIALG